jgi:hypothetical protein
MPTWTIAKSKVEFAFKHWGFTEIADLTPHAQAKVNAIGLHPSGTLKQPNTLPKYFCCG